MDAESVSGHLLPPGSVYAFLAEHRRVRRVQPTHAAQRSRRRLAPRSDLDLRFSPDSLEETA